MRILHVGFAVFSLLLISCNSVDALKNNKVKLAVSTQQAEEKRFKRNPAAQEHYQMMITIDNAPGSFEHVKAFAHYSVQNCTYMLAGDANATAKPDIHIPLDFKKITDNQYQGDFYVDAMKDEDYYKQGICKWQFIEVNALLSATDSAQDTQFSASINSADLQKKMVELNHLTTKYPTVEKMPAALSQGHLKKAHFKPEEYFTINVALKRLP